MTVAELIAELQKHPPELEVEFNDGEWGPTEIDEVVADARDIADIPANRIVKLAFILLK